MPCFTGQTSGNIAFENYILIRNTEEYFSVTARKGGDIKTPLKFA